MAESDDYPTNPTGRLDLSAVTAGLLLVGRYRLDALLLHNRGVMSWRAIDQVLSRPVLIHLLDPDDERIGWVLQAARRAATVNDSRFLRVLDALEASGQEPWSFVVCEFAVGDSVQNLLTEGALTSKQAGFIVREVAAALGPLHGRGLFHLRISPDSVIITANGNIKIVGFLIDAALRPEPGEDALTWAEQEAIDTRALGALLYGATTMRWPVLPSEPQLAQYGLAPAPTTEQGWPTPAELNRQVDPELSAVTMAILRPGLGAVGPSLHTADEIADALDGVVGPTGAEESLENLVRIHRGLAASSPTPAVVRRTSDWVSTAADPEQATAQMAPVTQVPVTRAPATSAPVAATPVDPGPPVPPAAEPRPRPVATEPDRGRRPAAAETRPKPVPAPARTPKPAPVAGGTLSRRWVLVLVGFIVVALIALQLRGCGSDQPTEPGTPVPGEETSVVIEPVEIVAAFDFDPPADGGDANENSDQAHFAADGDPSTVWRTLTYLNNPVFGGLKPGVGMVLDLGREVPVATVSVILDNQPNAIQLMVPIESDPAAARPPMETVGQWQVIASNSAAGLQATLAPEAPVTTRWVMVYFTHLPPVGSALYRSGIAEAYVNR